MEHVTSCAGAWVCGSLYIAKCWSGKLFWCGRKVERILTNFRAWLRCPQSVVAMHGARHDAQLSVEPILEAQVAPHRILVQRRE
jgi:hypothetical protein